MKLKVRNGVSYVMRLSLLALCVALLPVTASAQDPDVDQVKVDAAIKRGVEWLRTQLGALDIQQGGSGTPGFQHLKRLNSTELVLWTFVHAGVLQDDEDLQKLWKKMIADRLEHTYNVSLQAMIVEEVDRVKYQWRLQQCAQFLVDNQCQNGQWSYGEEVDLEHIPPVENKDVATGGGTPKPGTTTEKPGKPKVAKTVKVEQRKFAQAFGDNSNAQYAALGLRACHDAGVILPAKVLNLGEQLWRGAQNKDGGWGYNSTANQEGSYGSMSAGAEGSLCIYIYMQKKDWKRDKDVSKGLEWMTKNFTVEKNTSAPAQSIATSMQYYYLYALERAGMLYGTETLGRHKWYPVGANYLINAQLKNGSWAAAQSQSGQNTIWDTCWAILFLRRATRPLKDVATGDARKK